MTPTKENEETVLNQILGDMIKSYLGEIGDLRGGYSSERDLTEYEKVIQLSREEMRNKSILDVGMSVKFLLDALKENLNIVVLEGCKGRSFAPHLSEYVRFGLAQEMPFPSNNFDLVIANNTVPLHLKSGDDFGALLSLYQLLRVCKSDGKVVVCPLPSEDRLRAERIINLNQPNFPRSLKWNIDLIPLLEQCNLEYECLPCGGDNTGDHVYHIQKSFDTDLKPMQRQLVRLGEARGYV